MNKKTELISIFLMFLCLNVYADEKSPTAIISVSNPDIKVLNSKNFSWSAKSRYVYDDERLEGFPLKKNFEDDIKSKLISSGFIFKENSQNPSLLVGYVIALESALSDLDINNLYGINPGFINKDIEKGGKNYEKGTMIIDIIEAQTNILVWRGAMQGMAEFGITDEKRKIRLKAAVDRLLDEFISVYGGN